MKHTNTPENTKFYQINDLITLEYEMTNSSFGYEYALADLESSDEMSWRAEELKQELEYYKTSYFSARSIFLDLDSKRLRDFESQLQNQKTALFAKQNYLH